jgi:hypothetical protein
MDPLRRLLLVSGLLVPFSSQPEREAILPRKVEVRPGMTGMEVQNLLGKPDRVARQILYRRYLEQWTYERPSLLIEFHGSKGQEVYVQTVHHLVPGRP